MTVDVAAAERFIFENARLLERHRAAVLLHDAPVEPVLDALRAYRNPDGGYGHALEPDVRGPESEPVSTLDALEVLVEIDATSDAMAAAAADWLATIAHSDGSIPMVMVAAADYPHAPWMVPSQGGSHLSFMLVAALSETDVTNAWLERAREWCWQRIEGREGLNGYWLKAGLGFLDRVADDQRAEAAIQAIETQLAPDGSIRVSGGTADERLRPLVVSPRPGLRSRTLFTQQQIDAELDLLDAGQQADGGWVFDFLAWCPGQALEWRGVVTLDALRTLRQHGRI